MRPHLALLSLPLSLTRPVFGATYTLSLSWQGEDFYEGFNWMTFDDPTHGRVNYVDLETSKARNLSWAGEGTFVMRGDSSNIIDPSSRGRDSVRIHSKDTYGDGILIADVSHMPIGCGAWPAIWTCSRAGPWPSGGEVDIIEGVYGIHSGYSNNLFSLHTTAGCTMSKDTNRGTGRVGNVECRGAVGCGVADTEKKSFGREFNANGGGIFVMRRSATRGFSFWFWPHNSGFLPSDISSGSQVIMESLWGQPLANFPPDSCDFAEYFDEHEIIINLTFAGDWAGSADVWAASHCAGDLGWTPDDYVNKNPQEYSEAYWEIKALRWYEEVPASSPSGSGPGSASGAKRCRAKDGTLRDV